LLRRVLEQPVYHELVFNEYFGWIGFRHGVILPIYPLVLRAASHVRGLSRRARSAATSRRLAAS
jgi:hypothetical protein